MVKLVHLRLAIKLDPQLDWLAACPDYKLAVVAVGVAAAQLGCKQAAVLVGAAAAVVAKALTCVAAQASSQNLHPFRPGLLEHSKLQP